MRRTAKVACTAILVFLLAPHGAETQLRTRGEHLGDDRANDDTDSSLAGDDLGIAPFEWPRLRQIGRGGTLVTGATLSFEEGAFSISRSMLMHREMHHETGKPVADIVIEIDDPRVLERIGWAFSPGFGALRYAKHDDVHGGIGSGRPFGELTISFQNAGDVHVGITPVGYCTNAADGASFDSTFFSGYLTELVDDVYFLETKEHVPQVWKEQLSGFAIVLDSGRQYRR